MTKQVELLPCPFCGEAAVILPHPGGTGLRIGCDNDQCPVEAYVYGIEPHKGYLIRDWNTRSLLRPVDLGELAGDAARVAPVVLTQEESDLVDAFKSHGGFPKMLALLTRLGVPKP